MADKMTLDFENNIITWDTDSQKGTEYFEGLKEMKEKILTLIGYEMINITPVINTINDFLNGKITEEELRKIVDEI